MVKINKAIFFDRDGVLINAPIKKNKPKSIQTLKQLKFSRDVSKICKFYKKKYYLIMITNQPDVAKKKNTKRNVIEINNYIKKKLNLDAVYVCFSDKDNHIDRKPNHGMLLKAKKKYKINLKNSYMIGDRWRDVGAGNKANCITIFIDKKYNEKLIYKPNYKISRLVEIFSIIGK